MNRRRLLQSAAGSLLSVSTSLGKPSNQPPNLQMPDRAAKPVLLSPRPGDTVSSDLSVFGTSGTCPGRICIYVYNTHGTKVGEACVSPIDGFWSTNIPLSLAPAPTENSPLSIRVMCEGNSATTTSIENILFESEAIVVGELNMHIVNDHNYRIPMLKKSAEAASYNVKTQHKKWNDTSIVSASIAALRVKGEDSIGDNKVKFVGQDFPKYEDGWFTLKIKNQKANNIIVLRIAFYIVSSDNSIISHTLHMAVMLP